MNDLTDKYINETEVNPNLAFLINEWHEWRILALQGSTRCLSGDTLVLTEFGYNQIKDISIGEYVYSVCGKDCKLKRVVNKFTYEAVRYQHKLITFVFDNQKIQCTYEHKFRINGKWIKAIDIARRKLEDTKQEVCCFNDRENSDIRQTFKDCKQSTGDNATGKGPRRIFENGNGQIDNQGPQGNSGSFPGEPKQQGNRQSYQRNKIGQSSRKPGVDHAQGEPGPRRENGICCESERGEKRKQQDIGNNRKGNKGRTTYSQEGIGSEIRCRDTYNKRNPRFKDLGLAKIKEVRFDYSDTQVYDLEVEDYHTYLITKDNIVSHNSGKTFSIVDFIIYLIEEYKGLTISVVRETLPSLKASILRDFKEEMLRLNLWTDQNFNKSELEYRHNGNLVEFFSIDDEQKVRGRKRQVLIGNEANEIPKDRWLQLMLRTEGIAIIDYNPSMTDSHIYDILERDDCAMIVTTYKNNPFLTPEIISEIERLKEADENLWKIYGCGIRGEDRAGIIYPKWVRTEIIPIDLMTWYGVDFGFTNDPSAIVRISYSPKDRTIWLKEVGYEKGLLNSDMARIIKQDIREKETQIYIDEKYNIRTKNSTIWVNENKLSINDYIEEPKKLKDMLDVSSTLLEHIERELKNIVDYLFEVYCDSAEPKSIQELRMYNVSAYPCIKGSGSIGSQIFFLYNFRILYCGENIDNERKKYKWKDKEKKTRTEDEPFDNVPIDAYNHILDAVRYGIYTHLVRLGI